MSLKAPAEKEAARLVKKPRGRPAPKEPRPGEVVGGGFIVNRLGDHTGRIRGSEWPFEHPNAESAKAEAERLAALFPGQRYAVLKVVERIGGTVE